MQSIGERFCLVVRLIASRSLDDILSDMSKIDHLAENLKWGTEALLTLLGDTAGSWDTDTVVAALNDKCAAARPRAAGLGEAWERPQKLLEQGGGGGGGGSAVGREEALRRVLW